MNEEYGIENYEEITKAFFNAMVSRGCLKEYLEGTEELQNKMFKDFLLNKIRENGEFLEKFNNDDSFKKNFINVVKQTI